MARIVKLKIGDQEVDAIEQDFEIGREEWSEYKLLDGGVIRVKTSVQKIFRIVDAQGQPLISPEGDPQVLVRHNTQVVASDRA